MDRHLPLAVDVLARHVPALAVRRRRTAQRAATSCSKRSRCTTTRPTKSINDLFARTLWRGANLGDPTIGFAETVTRDRSRHACAAWHRERYAPGTVIVAAAGNLDHDDVVALVAQHSADFAAAPSRRRRTVRPFTPGVNVTLDDTEQAYVMLGMPRALAARRAALRALGARYDPRRGHVEPALPRSARGARPGLRVSYSFQQSYRDAGLFGVSAGTSPERVQECVDVIVRRDSTGRRRRRDATTRWRARANTSRAT